VFDELIEKIKMMEQRKIFKPGEKRIDFYIEDFLRRWQEEGTLPVSIVDAIESYWKYWPEYWTKGRLFFLRNLKKRIPDFEDEIEELEKEIQNV